MFGLETTEDWFYATFGIVFMVMAISWIAFARLTMARIERRMREDGLPRPAQWDGVGYRALWYASAIAFPVGIFNLPNDPLFDVLTVRKYATPRDRIMGWAVMINGLLFVIIVFLGAFVFKFY